MKKIKTLTLLLNIVFILCNSCKLGDLGIAFSESFKTEIPSDQNGHPILFYAVAKTKQKQLGLDSLEHGFDDLQVRVWYDFSLFTTRRLVIISHKNIQWSAVVYDMKIDSDGDETIVSKDVKQVNPRHGWEFFSKKLLALNIMSLPNQDELPAYDLREDGTTFSVEIANKSNYRFYSYYDPGHYAEKSRNANNMVEILKLLEDELGVSNSP